MSKIRKSGTKAEVKLENELLARKLKFKKIDSRLPGTPDFVFQRKRLVVFCDGDFWHGRRWRERKQKLQKGTRPEYWVRKIESNRKRDKAVNRDLKKLGWRVLRLWETDILKKPDAAMRKILIELSRSA